MDNFVFVGFNLVLPFGSLLMDLVLLCANERALIDVWVDFNVRVVTQFESVLVIVSLEVQPGDLGQKKRA